MEVLELDGKKFVKAASVARELGYTSDYVGQLCRSGKVDAHLVGRSWYVDDSSIREHKTSRYRSSKKKTKQALQVSLEEQSATNEVPLRKVESEPKATHHFYSKLHKKNVKYNEDFSELIPVLTEKKSKESTNIEVRVAEAERLNVKKKSKSYKLKATELPKLKFKGDISVQTSEEEEETEKSSKGQKTATESVKRVHVKDTSFERKKAQKKAKEKAQKHTVKTKKLTTIDETPKEHDVPVRITGKIRNTDDSANENSIVKELKISKVAVSRPHKPRATFLYITGSAVLALILSVGALLVEESITGRADNEVSSRFSVNISNALNSINGLK